MFDEKKKALNLLNDSAIYKTSPRKPFVVISKYYKHIGINKERTSDLLLDWLKKQQCSIEFSEVIADLEKAVGNVYRKNYIFLHDLKADFYESEIDFVKKLKSKGEKHIAISLLYLSKIFGNDFYCYHLTLHRLTALSIRHIKRIIKKLEQSGLIDVTSRNNTKKIITKDDVAVKRYSLPNTYHIKIINSGEILFSCGDIDNIDGIIKMIK